MAPPGSYALLSSAMGIGAVAGGLFIARQKTVSSSRLVGAALMFGLTVLATAFMPSMSLAVAVLVLVGVASIGLISLGNSLLQLKSDPPDARPGHVVLEHGLPRLVDHRGADRGLVRRVYRAALGPGSRRISSPGRRSPGMAGHWQAQDPQGVPGSRLGPTETPPICTEALLIRPTHPQTSASALTLIVLTHCNCYLLVNLSLRAS
ncbi:MAG: MFS transporter [Anaerolineales bacterium]